MKRLKINTLTKKGFTNLDIFLFDIFFLENHKNSF